jgi:hypothetical protein
MSRSRQPQRTMNDAKEMSKMFAQSDVHPLRQGYTDEDIAHAQLRCEQNAAALHDAVIGQVSASLVCKFALLIYWPNKFSLSSSAEIVGSS